jgi:hypothetical protein
MSDHRVLLPQRLYQLSRSRAATHTPPLGRFVHKNSLLFWHDAVVSLEALGYILASLASGQTVLLMKKAPYSPT